jgi:esterase/lipase
MNTILIVSGLIVLFILFISFGPRPKLNPRAPDSRVPEELSVTELAEWIEQEEKKVHNLTPGAEASIQWANPEKPARTETCFLYIHGFSATRQETAPVTEMLADEHESNAYHARLEGHGVGPEGMLTESEQWLQSMIDAWAVASGLGNRVVIVATSTGAPLAIWLAHQETTRNRIHALLFMSPNFKIRSPFSFLLTWPWSKHWVGMIIGKEIKLESENDDAARYWTSTYSSLALIEMQKVVDWFARVDLSHQQIPLATMYMRNDSTISPKAAVKGHNEWGARHKQLIPVEPDGDAAEHVFVGHITAPARIDWCVSEFNKFLKSIN